MGGDDLDQMVGDSFGESDRNAGADADDQIRSCGAEHGQHLVDLLIAKRQHVTTGEQDFGHFGMPGAVIRRRLDILPGCRAVHRPGEAAEAVPAIGGAVIGDQESDPALVSMDQPVGDGMGYLLERVDILPGAGLVLVYGGHHLAPDRVVGVVRIDQMEIVVGNLDGKVSLLLEGGFVRGQCETFFEGLERTDAFHAVCCTGKGESLQQKRFVLSFSPWLHPRKA